MSVTIKKNLEERLSEIYTVNELRKNVFRYENLITKFHMLFGEKETRLFSAPGRTELGGNHTDHNKGLVLAASVQLDTIAAVAPRNDNEAVIYSDECGNTPFRVNLDELEPKKSEKGTLGALVRGVAKFFAERNYSTGGFDAVITSDIPFGAGLGSSASVEVLIGEIFNSLFNGGKVSKTEIALAGQFAENRYFGKPCGLMDQLACAHGGIIKIDFKSGAEIEKISFDFSKTGFSLLAVDTGKNHADLTDDYVSIIEDMRSVADFFGKDFLREISYEEFSASISKLREKVSDRAILRALHFFEENERVERQTAALLSNDFERFLRLVGESGNSSAKVLQNIFSPQRAQEQAVNLALILSEKFLGNGKGAVRVHGGGFAGAIQVYMPNESVPAYKNYIENIFGENSIHELRIRKTGVTEIRNV